MLLRLHIQNYAIIDEIQIDFSNRLNVITGETGAGKSILIGALSLILGERADTSVLLDSARKCFVEGVFLIRNKSDLQKQLHDNDLDSDDELAIRREISANGKSRAFVNDTPVNLDQLRQISTMLVDLHRQFDTQTLSESGFQRQVLDALAGNTSLYQQYQNVFYQWQHAQKELVALQQQKSMFDKEYDYNQFLFDELHEAGFGETELEEAESELKRLNHSEEIKHALSHASYELNESDQPVVQQLKSIHHQLGPFASYYPQLNDLLQRLQSVQIELADITEEVERLNEHIGYDKSRIAQLNDRVSQGYKLLKKHGVQSTAELLKIQQSLEDKLQAVLHIDEAITSGQQSVNKLLEQVQGLAARLTESRNKQIAPLETKVNKLLARVGMPNARLRITSQSREADMHGGDNIEFLFDANKSGRFEPLRKVASGGELSRLMLCIKSLIAESIDLPTLIFDEIDTGISGEAAKQVGSIMKDLAGSRQVISITHQPQIAGKAHAHFYVYKEIKGNSIKTSIRQLQPDERIMAIAQMLSGEKPTAAAMENAREMMN